jgi:hypothetical protein
LFDQYSERAKRVIFLTRLKAGKSGAAALDTGHLIEAVILEDQGKVAEVLGVPPNALGRLATANPRPSVQFFAPEAAAAILEKLQQALPQGKAIPDHVDMPISPTLSRAA